MNLQRSKQGRISSGFEHKMRLLVILVNGTKLRNMPIPIFYQLQGQCSVTATIYMGFGTQIPVKTLQKQTLKTKVYCLVFRSPV